MHLGLFSFFSAKGAVMTKRRPPRETRALLWRCCAPSADTSAAAESNEGKSGAVACPGQGLQQVCHHHGGAFLHRAEEADALHGSQGAWETRKVDRWVLRRTKRSQVGGGVGGGGKGCCRMLLCQV